MLAITAQVAAASATADLINAHKIPSFEAFQKFGGRIAALCAAVWALLELVGVTSGFGINTADLYDVVIPYQAYLLLHADHNRALLAAFAKQQKKGTCTCILINLSFFSKIEWSTFLHF